MKMDVAIRAYTQQLRDNGNNVLSTTWCSKDGTGCITVIKGKQLSKDTPEVVTCIKDLGHGYSVVVQVLCDEEYGYQSVPVESEMFGVRKGSLNLSEVVNHLPTAYTDKACAEKYLSRNPKMLLDKLSGVLNMQSQIIEKTSREYCHLDWDLANVYSSTTTKTRKLMDLLFGKKVKDRLLPSLKNAMEETK